MDIYLDIDGVLLGTASPAEDTAGLAEYILEHYPGRTYWLTTHCSSGENRCAEWLRDNGFPENLVDRMDAGIQPTRWRTLKTEAIDFSRPFLWLDDAPLYSELKALEDRGAAGSLLRMNKKDPRAAANALRRLREMNGETE